MQLKNKTNIVIGCLLLIGILYWIYQPLFSSQLSTSGDFTYFYQSMYKYQYVYPYTWSTTWGNGFGAVANIITWVNLVFSTPIYLFGHLLKLPWEYIEKIAFFYPFLLFSVLFSTYFMRTLFPKNNYYLLAAGIFTANSFILMAVGGGQLLIALAYAAALLIIGVAIKATHAVFTQKPLKEIIRYSIVLGLLSGVQFVLDPRIAYLTLIAVALFYALRIILLANVTIHLRTISKFFVTLGVLPLLFVLSLHLFWILPTVFYRSNPVEQLSSAYTSHEAVNYFSFASFENSLSLLHPNWPENIFGKTTFFQPEFLLLPLLAFGTLIFIKRKQEKNTNGDSIYLIYYFCLLGLLGAFLAKGSNEPFGFIYLLLFDYFPGFVMFRDPSKWYVLTAISYAVLIPLCLAHLTSLLQSIISKKKGKTYSELVSVFFVIAVSGVLLYQIRPALTHQLTGTFQKQQIPKEYVSLQNTLNNDVVFSRTLWVPSIHPFAYTTPLHPAVSSDAMFPGESIKILDSLLQGKTENNLQNASIKYIVIPLTDRVDKREDESKFLSRQNTIAQQVKELPDTRLILRTPQFYLFEVDSPRDHFWSPAKNVVMKNTFINPTKYSLSVENAKKGDLIVFSEQYHPEWSLNVNGNSIRSQKYNGMFNSFVIEEEGNFQATAEFRVQKLGDVGVMVSSAVLAILYLTMIYLTVRIRSRKK